MPNSLQKTLHELIARELGIPAEDVDRLDLCRFRRFMQAEPLYHRLPNLTPEERLVWSGRLNKIALEILNNPTTSCFS